MKPWKTTFAFYVHLIILTWVRWAINITRGSCLWNWLIVMWSASILLTANWKIVGTDDHQILGMLMINIPVLGMRTRLEIIYCCDQNEQYDKASSGMAWRKEGAPKYRRGMYATCSMSMCDGVKIGIWFTSTWRKANKYCEQECPCLLNCVCARRFSAPHLLSPVFWIWCPMTVFW